jgi:putative ABC transport system permease protein
VFFAAMGLFVGAFLIFNSFQITVLQRQRELGMLRTLGASRGAITRLILREALALGVTGTAAGLGIGVLLAVGLVELMSAIGFPVSGLRFSLPAALVAVLGGMLVTVLGALVPALRAGRVAPIRALLGLGEARRRPSRWRLAVGGVLVGLGLAGVFVLASASDLSAAVGAAGMLGVIFIFLGVSLAAPFAIVPLVRVLSWPLRLVFPIEGRLAADSAGANPGRTAATASGLMIGLALVTAFGSLGSSFLGSVQDEFDSAFARDLTIQPRGFSPGAGLQQQVSPRLRERVAALPEVEVVTPERFFFADDVLPGAGEGVVFGFDPAEYGRVDDSSFAGDVSEEEVLARVAAGQVTVGEAVAKEEGLSEGDTVLLRGSAGERRARVAGIVETSIFGGQTVGTSLETMAAVYGVTSDSDLAVKAVSADAREPLERKLEQIVDADYPQLQVLSNDELKDEVESQVNQQFGFFNALLFVAVLVSLFGVINTLSMNVLERTREIGLLRALGSSRWQVRRQIGDEGLLLSLTGALLGLAVGLALGWVFVQGIASAVPTVSYSAPVTTVAAVGLAGVVLGLLASVLPARRAARMDVIRALSYE